VQKITRDFAQKRWDNRSKKYLELYIRYYYEMFIHDELTLAELNTAWQYRKVKSFRNLPQQQPLTTKQLSMLLDDFAFYEGYIRRMTELLTEQGFKAEKMILPHLLPDGTVASEPSFSIGPVHGIQIRINDAFISFQQRETPSPTISLQALRTIIQVFRLNLAETTPANRWAIWHGDFLQVHRLATQQYIPSKFSKTFLPSFYAILMPGSVLQDDDIFTLANFVVAQHALAHIALQENDIFIAPQKGEKIQNVEAIHQNGFFFSEIMADGQSIGLAEEFLGFKRDDFAAQLAHSEFEFASLAPWIAEQGEPILTAQLAQLEKDLKQDKVEAEKDFKNLAQVLDFAAQALAENFVVNRPPQKNEVQVFTDGISFYAGDQRLTLTAVQAQSIKSKEEAHATWAKRIKDAQTQLDDVLIKR
ncbi:MAG: hypothetical protein J6Y94_03480, partial [Bacteriovoracaceae bacterium]|nr:hypothetical protein [Bacteriovoracaceae bacterium]